VSFTAEFWLAKKSESLTASSRERVLSQATGTTHSASDGSSMCWDAPGEAVASR
jgi:hypothetical protein